MSLTTNNINQNELQLAAERLHVLTNRPLSHNGNSSYCYTGWMVILPIFIGRDGTFSFENYERMWKSKAYTKYLSQLLKLAFLPQLFVLLLVTPLHISCRSYPESGQIYV